MVYRDSQTIFPFFFFFLPSSGQFVTLWCNSWIQSQPKMTIQTLAYIYIYICRCKHFLQNLDRTEKRGKYKWQQHEPFCDKSTHSSSRKPQQLTQSNWQAIVLNRERFDHLYKFGIIFAVSSWPWVLQTTMYRAVMY